jgi:hypothetical protein
MYALTAPNRDYVADYASCVAAGQRTARIRTLLTAATQQVGTAFGNYQTARANAGAILPLAVADALKRAWKENYKYISSAGAMAHLRAELMALARNGRCPFCGIGAAATLDHYLPKSRYPEFATLALNLIPACDLCNRSKGHKVGTVAEQQMLHAYFHQLPDEEVLQAHVFLQQTVVVRYELNQTPNLDDQTYARAQYQFKRLKLTQHFGRATNQELSDRRIALSLIYGAQRDGNAVRESLARDAESARQARGRNDWKTALLLALSRHNDFCAGGFELIA